MWISRLKAAALLECSPTTVGRLITIGELHRRPGRWPSLDRDEVEALAKRRLEEWLARDQALTEREALRRRAGRPDDVHEWLTVTQAAVQLGLSSDMVYKLARQERLPFTDSFGRRWFRADLVDLVARAREARKHPVSRGG